MNKKKIIKNWWHFVLNSERVHIKLNTYRPAGYLDKHKMFLILFNKEYLFNKDYHTYSSFERGLNERNDIFRFIISN